MSDLSSNIVEGVIWTVNGFLVIAYYAADHIQTLALAVATILFAAYTSQEQRKWAMGSGAGAILASLLAPAPVPLFLLVMSLAGWAGTWLEQYNKPAQHWNTIRGQALYAVAGLGFAGYRHFGLGSSIASDGSCCRLDRNAARSRGRADPSAMRPVMRSISAMRRKVSCALSYPPWISAATAPWRATSSLRPTSGWWIQ